MTKYSDILTQTQDLRLGYSLDSRYYGIPEYTPYMREQLARLTVEDVNSAIKRYLKSSKMRVVVVTKNGTAFRDSILKNQPSPITYNSPKSNEILAEDGVIQTYRINVKSEDVVVVPAEEVFQ